MENDLEIWEMAKWEIAKICGKWEIAKICGEWLKYLINGLIN